MMKTLTSALAGALFLLSWGPVLAPAQTKKELKKEQECDDTEIRLSALQALQSAKSEHFLPSVRKLYEHPDSCSNVLRRRALQYLGTSPYGNAATPEDQAEITAILVIAATNDLEVEVRKEAVGMLRFDTSLAAAKGLGKALTATGDADLQETILQALSSGQTSLWQRNIPGLRKSLRDFILSAPAEPRVGRALSMLGTQVTAGRGDRVSAQDAKDLMTESSGYLREVYPKLSNQGLKKQVIAFLGQFGGSANMSWLASTAAGDDEVDTRRSALSYALGSYYGYSSGQVGLLGARQATPVELVNVYDKIKDRPLRQELVSYFGTEKDDKAFDKLVAIAKGDKDPTIRATAVTALWQSPHPRAKEVVAQLQR